MKVYIVTQDRNGAVTVRLTPVDKKYLEGPGKTCSQVAGYIYPKTVRKMALLLAEAE
jgi:hypothetical protein